MGAVMVNAMNALMSFISWIAGLLHKAPVKLVPTIFVTEVESSSQRFGIMYFKISFTNNSSLLAKIVGVECSF